MKKYVKTIKKLAGSSFILMLGLFAAGFFSESHIKLFAEQRRVKEHDVRELTSISDISYEETTDEILNPYIGFYKPVYMTLLKENNDEVNESFNLTHIRCDLSEFSGSRNGVGDAELTGDALDTFENELKFIRKNHHTAIVRFAYHPYFDSNYDVYEPSMKMILKHQEQLGEIISRYPDVVIAVECGLFGKWGEMHGSSMAVQDNFNQAIDKWLEVLPPEVTLNLRTPGYLCGWNGADISKMSSYIYTPKDKEYRVGIYNDGYLGNDGGDRPDSDLWTFVNREEEIKWLSNQAKHTLYGGEIVANDGSGNVKNTAAYMETEAFRTHTSYLNLLWNNNVVDDMKKESYSGKDPVYEGKTGFEYIRNHIGYRFVVRDVRLTKETTTYEDFGLEAKIENVGFANLIRDKKLILIFENESKSYSVLLKDKNLIDKSVLSPTAWDSQKITKLKVQLDLPEDMPIGEYKVYLRLADDESTKSLSGYPIKFANKDKSEEKNVWSSDNGANLLGSFSIADISTIEKDEGQDGKASESGMTEDNKTTFHVGKKRVKNKSKIKKTAKIKIRDKDKIKKITLNGKKVKIKSGKKTFTLSLKAYKKKLRKKGKWNTLVVVDAKGNRRNLKFKTK